MKNKKLQTMCWFYHFDIISFVNRIWNTKKKANFFFFYLILFVVRFRLLFGNLKFVFIGRVFVVVVCFCLPIWVINYSINICLLVLIKKTLGRLLQSHFTSRNIFILFFFINFYRLNSSKLIFFFYFSVFAFVLSFDLFTSKIHKYFSFRIFFAV